MPKITVEIDVSDRELERMRIVLERAASLQKSMQETGIRVGSRACVEAVIAFFS